jgi:L-ascorbate metabolism protein UlaG (beta-lactamase superfamily)
MEITWYGLSCFRLTQRGLATVVTDPYDSSVGLTSPKLKADIVTISHDSPGHSSLKALKGKYRAIASPGEYEIGGVFITGIELDGGKRASDEQEGARRNILYVFEYDDLTIAHLGDLSKVPSQSQIENLGTVDVALVPVGGGEALNPAQAAETISLIEPSMVVPMHHKTGKEKLELGPVAPFLSEMGISNAEAKPSLKVSKSSMSDETQVVVLERAA